MYAKHLEGSSSKNKKLTGYFIGRLVELFGMKGVDVDKCSQAPFGVQSKIMDLLQLIVAGKKDYHELDILGKWLCPELGTVSSQLTNSVVYNNVKDFISQHVHTAVNK